MPSESYNNSSALGLQLRSQNGRREVFDPIRRRWVRYTPEERIRQLFIRWLVEDVGYPCGRLGNEVSLDLNGTWRRCDTAVYDGAGNPVMIIEYKAPNVALTMDVFEQIARYNIALQTKWLAVTNGKNLYCCRIKKEKDSTDFEFLSDFPSYEDLIVK